MGFASFDDHPFLQNIKTGKLSALAISFVGELCGQPQLYDLDFELKVSHNVKFIKMREKTRFFCLQNNGHIL